MTRTPLNAETHCTIIPPYLLERMVQTDRREVLSKDTAGVHAGPD